MAQRTKVSAARQSEVLLQSRRRCCICFGLHRDLKVKRGQIAHLDGDRNNNNLDNLAYLCLDHHDTFDGRTSQSKGLQVNEVKEYLKELQYHFSSWSVQLQRDELLNFLAFHAADLESMTNAAINAGGSVVFYGTEHAFDVLITDNVDYCDPDLFMPHIAVLDLFSSWGWVEFSYEERKSDDEMRTFITVKRKPVCDHVAASILKRYEGDKELQERFRHTMKYRNWNPPSD